MKRLLVILLAICSTAALGRTESLPQGTYHDAGQVVELADGELGLFRCGSAYHFAKPLQPALRPFLHRFVQITYTRAGPLGIEGSPIVSIDKVTPYADSPAALPVSAVAQPTQKVFGFDQPVTVRISIQNRTAQPQSIDLRNCRTCLCQDYSEKKSLEPADQYVDLHPYGLASNRIELPAGEKLDFTATACRVIPPGNYQVVYILAENSDAWAHSECANIVVRPPANDVEKKSALQKWLKIAAMADRVSVAKQLLQLGDDSGAKEILRLLKSGAYTPHQDWSYGGEIPFVLNHCGKEGDDAVRDIIEHSKKQEQVLSMMDAVPCSPRRVALLHDLLLCQNLTYGPDDWAPRPRICDVAGYWLAGYTKDLHFPVRGTEHERDAVLTKLHERLESQPETLDFLTRPATDPFP